MRGFPPMQSHTYVYADVWETVELNLDSVIYMNALLLLDHSLNLPGWLLLERYDWGAFVPIGCGAPQIYLAKCSAFCDISNLGGAVHHVV